METSLQYGKTTIPVTLPDRNLLGVIRAETVTGLADPQGAVLAALADPIGTEPLRRLASRKKEGKVVIVVNDVTRPTPYEHMLPPLLAELAAAGIQPGQICFVIATGIHRDNTEAENRKIFTEPVVETYRFINHNCRENLVKVGTLSDGTDLVINREVAEADLLITTGLIGLHYFAGYSGGRKSILPGVAREDLIARSHSQMTDPRATAGNYRDNPVHAIMMEAARKVGVDFILNVVTNDRKEIVGVVAGDLEVAWLEGVKLCERLFTVPVAAPADVVVASAGGYPKDINVYQAQKALENAAVATRPGGTVILAAACNEGYGEEVFARWMREAASIDDIFRRFARGFELGGHKAYAIARILREKEVILVSDLPPQEVKNLFFQPAASVAAALELIEAKYGPDYKALLFPQAGMVLPRLESGTGGTEKR